MLTFTKLASHIAQTGKVFLDVGNVLQSQPFIIVAL